MAWDRWIDLCVLVEGYLVFVCLLSCLCPLCSACVVYYVCVYMYEMVSVYEISVLPCVLVHVKWVRIDQQEGTVNWFWNDQSPTHINLLLSDSISGEICWNLSQSMCVACIFYNIFCFRCDKYYLSYSKHGTETRPSVWYKCYVFACLWYFVLWSKMKRIGMTTKKLFGYSAIGGNFMMKMHYNLYRWT